MSTPTTERGAMQRIIRALRADGWELRHVDNQRVSNEKEAIAAIESTGVAHLRVRRPMQGDLRRERGWVFFVLGNAPDEVANDWTTNLTAVDTVMNGWW